jgi:2-phosphosulfolactate phosphatase
VDIIHATGIDGARKAIGTVVVIDVLRAFTVSAYALAGGALECRLVRTVDEGKALAARIPGAILCAEENGLPVPGVEISNSPTKIASTDLNGKVLVQRSSAGTQAAAEAQGAGNGDQDDIFAASLVVARATVQACLLRQPKTLTLLASADHPEDHACAQYMAQLIQNKEPDIERLLKPLKESDRYRKLSSGTWPGFPPTDLELSLKPDRFDFAMRATKQEGHLTLTKVVPKAALR